MARKKSKRKSEPKKPSTAPEDFWRQGWAFVLGAVLAPLLTLAMFNLGGSLPVRLFDGTRWLIGVSAYLAPALLIYSAVKIFRSDDHRLPRSAFWGVVLFLTSLTGLAHLGVDPERSLEAANNGQNGGMLGHIASSLIQPFLDTIGTTIVFLGGGLLSLLFILRIPVKNFIKGLIRPFRKTPEEEAEAAKAAGFQLNEGVPIEKGGKLSDFKDTAKPLSAAEAHNALTTTTDPDWELPGLELLSDKQEEANPGDVEERAEIIKDTLSDFNIDAEMAGANVGPRVTQYTLKPPSGVRMSKIASLDDNLAFSLAAESIRIEAPIPGQRAVGIEVPNLKPASVRIRGVFDSNEWKAATSPLSFVVGRDISGNPIVADLDKMPHLLIAGQTGSGKSIMINTLLTSFLYRNSPSNLKMILVDPKRVELKPFDEIPHLLAPVITEPEKTISALKWAVAEMERRYQSLSEANKRNIGEYNAARKDQTMPYIIIVIDELADLMMMAARDVETLVVRVSQKARAVGIHLVLATQRPSVDVITGLIKANVPGRIAFTTVNDVDSRTILGQMGAEKLLGLGDMLFTNGQMPRPKRHQGALIDTDEVEKVVDFVRQQRAPEYDDEVVTQPVQLGNAAGGLSGDEIDDSLYQEAVSLVVETGKASTSYLQRRFSIGYTRAARLIDMMESQGIVAPAHGNKPRQVLARPDQRDEMFGDASEPSEEA